PALGTREGFVRAGRHPCGPFAPGILKLATDNQPKDMRPIIQDRDSPVATHGGELPYRLRKQEQTLPQHNHARRHLVDELEALLDVQVIQILGQREVVQWDRLWRVEIE